VAHPGSIGIALNAAHFPDGADLSLILAVVLPDMDVAAIARELRGAVSGDPAIVLVSGAGCLCSRPEGGLHLSPEDSPGGIVLQAFSRDMIEQLHIVRVPLGPAGDPERRTDRIADTLSLVTVPFPLDACNTLALTFIDGQSGAESSFMEAVYRVNRFLCPFVGGSAAAADAARLSDGGSALPTGEALIIFIKLAAGAAYGIFKTQNVRKKGSVGMVVAATDITGRSVTQFIDPRTLEILSATDGLARLLGCAPRDLLTTLPHHAVGIELEGGVFVRSVANVDNDAGAVTFFCDLGPGDELHSLERTDLVRQTETDWAAFLKDKPPPVGILLNDCVQRRSAIIADAGRLRMFDGIPVAGYSGFGELFGINVNQTLTAAVFFQTTDGARVIDPCVDLFPAYYSGFRNYFTVRRYNQQLLLNRLRTEIIERLVPRLADADAGSTDAPVVDSIDFLSDLSLVRVHQERLSRMAYYDALTGLPNRLLLTERLQQEVERARHTGKLLAVAYLDLDGFKPVNDTLGHDAGDMLLAAVANRLRHCFRPGDTVCRVGGDEFVSLLPGLETAADAQRAAGRALAAVARPFEIRGQPVTVSASIGLTLFPQDGSDAGVLLRHADQAMYLAKQTGRNRCHVFDISDNLRVSEARERQARIQTGLNLGEFELFYQPKLDLRCGRVVGAEALVRWNHPERGLLAPDDFLPDLENSDTIVALGDWVMETALCQMAIWHRKGLDITVSVNVAARQLQESRFVAKVRERLGRWPELPAGSLEIEIVETAALEDVDAVSTVIRACRDMGVSFAIDDFGTGYSSLSYLRRLPVDVLKIDKSFVIDMPDQPDSLTIVRAVIGLARAFDRRVVAEGVEGPQHVAMLLDLGCDLGQGFGIAPPLPAAEFTGWLGVRFEGSVSTHAGLVCESVNRSGFPGNCIQAASGGS
jgi:diguanylate cyclase (GGDEF)-like protein